MSVCVLGGFFEFQVSHNMYIQPQKHCQLKISNCPINESFVQDPSGIFDLGDGCYHETKPDKSRV